MAKRDYISAIFLIIILIVLSQSALSIGLSTIEIPKYIVALPNEKHVFSFEANGYTYDVLPYVVGDPDLTEYVILTEAKETYPYHKQFDAILQFPAEINATPGLRTVFVGAEEILAGTSQGVSAKTKVQYALKIQVLYDTRYIEASFSTQNVNMNSIADFAVGVKNFGKPNIKVLMVTVDVYSNGDLIKEITSDLYSLNSGKEINIPIQLNTSGMKPGDYNATATVYYDGDEKPLEGIFKI
ncbi:MAG: hypothetical protein KKE20_01730, partial [Nanoarchaeota archaeon]|nr:hypothetical protein [Nanoarchaeota archaeon]